MRIVRYSVDTMHGDNIVSELKHIFQGALMTADQSVVVVVEVCDKRLLPAACADVLSLSG